MITNFFVNDNDTESDDDEPNAKRQKRESARQQIGFCASRGLYTMKRSGFSAAKYASTQRPKTCLHHPPAARHLPNPGQDGDSCCDSAHHVRQLRALDLHLQRSEDVRQSVLESVFCGVPRLPQPRGSVRPRVPVRGRLPGVDAAKAACWSTRDREARRLELTPGSDSVGTQSLTSLLTSMHFCVRTVIAHQCLLRPILNC